MLASLDPIGVTLFFFLSISNKKMDQPFRSAFIELKHKTKFELPPNQKVTKKRQRRKAI